MTSGNEAAKKLLREAYEHLHSGDDLNLAFHQFNLLLNETIHKDKAELDVMLFYIACCNLKMEHYALTILLLKQCIKMRPDFVAAINNLGYVYKKEGLSDLSKSCFKEVVRIIDSNTQEISDIDKAEYYTNYGSSMIANGAPKEALEYFDKAQSLDPNKDILIWNRGLANLELGNYADGFREYGHGERGDLAKRRVYTPEGLPEWDGTPGKNIIVYGEQGIGDEIMFASVLPDLANDCKFVFDGHPRLVQLFRNSFPGLVVYGSRKTEVRDITWLKYHDKFDAKIAIGSLGIHYRKKVEDFPRAPYIIANPVISAKYAEKLAKMGDKPKIGFSWRGGIKTTNGQARYIQLEKWKELFKLDVDFISLQYNKDAEQEVAEFEKKYGFNLNHWSDTLADYDETAGLVDNLDLIISVPQSVVHLAGAMGKIVWQLAPKRAMWQVGVYGENMPWYQAVQNFWQDDSEKWEPVLIRVKDELCNLLAKNTEN